MLINTAYTENANNLSNFKYGLQVYKKANCMGCHSWHGKGGGGYGGGSSLRETLLDYDGIKFVVKCGILGTGMPYFDRFGYKNNSCYEIDNNDVEYKPKNSKKFLNDRQINAVASFVYNQLKGKLVDYDYCVNFYSSSSKVCEQFKLEIKK